MSTRRLPTLLVWLQYSAIFAVLLSGCAGPAPSKADIAGVWKNITGAQFTFFSDGRFLVKNLPRRLIDLKAKEKYNWGSGSDKDVIIGKGTWALVEQPGKAAWKSGRVWWDVRLIFDSLPGFQGTVGDSVMYTAETERPTLFFWTGEEGGDRFEFFKAEGQRPKSTL